MRVGFLQGDDWRAASASILDADEVAYGRLLGKPEGWIVEDGGRIVLVATGKKRLLFTQGPMEAVDALAAVAPKPPAFAGPIDVTARFATHLPGSRRWLRAHLRVATQVQAPESPGQLRLATDEDVPALRPWGPGFHRDTGHPGEPSGTDVDDFVKAGKLWLWEHDGPRSIAGVVRETPRGAAISFVYTPPELRRQGWAAACVGQLSRRLLTQKQYVALYADAANPGSNRLYERLGFAAVGLSDEWITA
jgi:ribosomal protein S18 acetylase RimI-like enzyme